MPAMDDVFAFNSEFHWHFGTAFATRLEHSLSPNSLMKALSDCRLYTFVDTAYLRGRPPELIAQQLCNGGSDIIQLRAKTSTGEEVRAMAESILPICERAGVRLVINDYPRIAFDLSVNRSISDCTGCHLGQEDFFDAGHSTISQF